MLLVVYFFITFGLPRVGSVNMPVLSTQNLIWYVYYCTVWTTGFFIHKWTSFVRVVVYFRPEWVEHWLLSKYSIFIFFSKCLFPLMPLSVYWIMVRMMRLVRNRYCNFPNAIHLFVKTCHFPKQPGGLLLGDRGSFSTTRKLVQFYNVAVLWTTYM